MQCPFIAFTLTHREKNSQIASGLRIRREISSRLLESKKKEAAEAQLSKIVKKPQQLVGRRAVL